METDAVRRALRDALLRIAPREGAARTAVAGLRVSRWNAPRQASCYLLTPVALLMVQGSKREIFGAEEVLLPQGHCVVCGVNLPCVGKVEEASARAPYLSCVLDLDPAVLAGLLAALPPDAVPAAAGAPRAIAHAEADAALLDGFLRLAGTLDDGVRGAALAPLIIREIYTVLLLGPLGSHLRTIHTKGSQAGRVAEAVAWLTAHYNEPVTVRGLADLVHMSEPTFFRRFREVTSLSPLQYQKRLRLYEAQRLMLSGDEDASTAGYSVGYESVTQFSREYKRMFGESPARDVKRRLAS